ncbi:hypothetical protein [Rhodococcus opacus]|nr:hypothetical protein [Rhodococcus opacus]
MRLDDATRHKVTCLPDRVRTVAAIGRLRDSTGMTPPTAKDAVDQL